MAGQILPRDLSAYRGLGLNLPHTGHVHGPLAEVAEAVWAALQGACAPVCLIVFGSSVSSLGRDVDMLCLVEERQGWTPRSNMMIATELRRRVAPAYGLDPYVRTRRQYALAQAIPGTLEHVASREGRVLVGKAPPAVRASPSAKRRIAVAAARAWFDTALRNRSESSDRPTRGMRGALRAAAMGIAALTGFPPPQAQAPDDMWVRFLQRALAMGRASPPPHEEDPLRLSDATWRTAMQHLARALGGHSEAAHPTSG